MGLAMEVASGLAPNPAFVQDFTLFQPLPESIPAKLRLLENHCFLRRGGDGPFSSSRHWLSARLKSSFLPGEEIHRR